MLDLVRERFFKEGNQIWVEPAGHPELRPIYPNRTILTGMIDLDNSGNRRALGLFHRHDQICSQTAMQLHRPGICLAVLNAVSERFAPEILIAFFVSSAIEGYCSPPMGSPTFSKWLIKFSLSRTFSRYWAAA